MAVVIQLLMASEDPCVWYKTLLRGIGESPGSSKARELASQVRQSTRVKTLLSLQDKNGRIPGNAYAKFTGAHWTLSVLADLDYPPGDISLIPLRDQVYETWLKPDHTKEWVMDRQAGQYKSRPGVPIIQGRARRCGSQEGNALWSTLKLGIADERADQLALNLVRWQWPDGGWNCDRKMDAIHSSFYETLIPMRALALHGRMHNNQASSEAAYRAAEVFLKRHLFKKQQDGSTINDDFVKLHYPCYWHYDILFALKVMLEMDLIHDPRCIEALNLLASKRLPDGGFPSEYKYYKVVEEPQPGGSLVDWGGVSRTRMNEYVTVDALLVLQAAGMNV